MRAAPNKADAQPFTIDHLTLALRVKVHAAGYLLLLHGVSASAEEAADAILTHHLTHAICGKHGNKAIKYWQAWEICFGGKWK